MNRQLPFTDPVPGTGQKTSTDDSFLGACYKRLFSEATLFLMARALGIS